MCFYKTKAVQGDVLIRLATLNKELGVSSVWGVGLVAVNLQLARPPPSTITTPADVKVRPR